MGCNNVQSWVSSATGALFFGLWTQALSSQQSELLSETLSWLILPSLFGLAGKFRDNTTPRLGSLQTPSKPPSWLSLWVIAICYSATSVFRAERGTIYIFPALTPLLLLGAQKGTRAELGTELISSYALEGVRLTCLIALLSIPALSGFDLIASLWSILPAATLLVVYASFSTNLKPRLQFLSAIRFEDAIYSLSWRMVVILVISIGAQIIKYGLSFDEIVPSLGLALVKALSWFFTVQTAKQASWSIAPAIGTFSLIATQSPFSQTWDIQALLLLTSSLLGLGHVVRSVPSTVKSRTSLWIFTIVPILPYLTNIYLTRNATLSADVGPGSSLQHPIEILADQAKAQFANLVSRQSKSYMDAEKEYHRRYGIKPPPGFEDWYRYAAANNPSIIDDFDAIHRAISPLLKMHGIDVLQIIARLNEAQDTELWRCKLTTKPNKVDCSHPWRTNDRNYGMLLNKLIGNTSATFPNVEFFINHLDEPRVIIPPPHTEHNTTKYDLTFTQTDLSNQPTWTSLTKYCKFSTDTTTTSPTTLYDLPFVTNHTSAMNLCQHPEYHNKHGLFLSPTSFHLFTGSVPILSTGAPSTMSDILLPSPAYIESKFQYNPKSDMPWAKKYNNLYWAGSTTGAFSNPNSSLWRHFHRQRFVALAQNLAPSSSHSYLHNIAGNLQRIQSTFLNSRLYNVFFTNIHQCNPPTCYAQSTFFRTRTWADKDAALSSRLVFDIDGNGISGRFYKLLASNSCVLKQTVLREWHDERLVPWYHYVPVSLDMRELPELVFFLTSTERGRVVAERIAEQGKEWFGKAFREVDMRVYVWRLLLELGRVADERREAPIK